jgi:O-antigen/teichoic acid export membrane protein
VKNDFFALVLGRGVQAVLAFALLKVLTNQLAQSEVGHYYFLVALTSWFALLVLNPVGMWLNRHIAEWRDRFHWAPILKRIIGFYLAVAVVGAALGAFVNFEFALNSALSFAQTFFCIFGGILFLSFYQMVSGLQNIIGSKVTYSKQIAVGQIIVTIAASGIFFLPQPNVFMWFGLLFFGNGLGSIIFLRAVAESFRNSSQAAEHTSPATHDLIGFTDLLSFCVPILGVTFAAWLQTQGYRVVISKTVGIEGLAVMAVGLAIAANIGGTVESLIQQFLVPDFYRALAKKDGTDESAWQSMFDKALMLSGLACAMIYCFAPFILRLLTKESYLEATLYLRWGAIIEYLRILTNIIYLRFVGHKQIARAIPAFLCSALINVAVYSSLFYWQTASEKLILMSLTLASAVALVGLGFRVYRDVKWNFPTKTCLWSVLYASPLGLGLLLPEQMHLVPAGAVMFLACVYLLLVSARIT